MVGLCAFKGFLWLNNSRFNFCSPRLYRYNPWELSSHPWGGLGGYQTHLINSYQFKSTCPSVTETCALVLLFHSLLKVVIPLSLGWLSLLILFLPSPSWFLWRILSKEETYLEISQHWFYLNFQQLSLLPKPLPSITNALIRCLENWSLLEHTILVKTVSSYCW